MKGRRTSLPFFLCSIEICGIMWEEEKKRSDNRFVRFSPEGFHF